MEFNQLFSDAFGVKIEIVASSHAIQCCQDKFVGLFTLSLSRALFLPGDVLARRHTRSPMTHPRS